MDDMREELVKLISEIQYMGGLESRLAEHLIANGVTIQRWIPMTERLPEQGQEVIVYSGGVLKPTVFAYQFWDKHYDNWARITHWMPLPEPPEEV